MVFKQLIRTPIHCTIMKTRRGRLNARSNRELALAGVTLNKSDVITRRGRLLVPKRYVTRLSPQALKDQLRDQLCQRKASTWLLDRVSCLKRWWDKMPIERVEYQRALSSAQFWRSLFPDECFLGYKSSVRVIVSHMTECVAPSDDDMFKLQPIYAKHEEEFNVSINLYLLGRMTIDDLMSIYKRDTATARRSPLYTLDRDDEVKCGEDFREAVELYALEFLAIHMFLASVPNPPYFQDWDDIVAMASTIEATSTLFY